MTMHIKKYCFLLLSIFSLQPLFGQIVDSTLLVHSGKVFFAFGKYELPSKADTVLQTFLEKVKDLENIQIRITAHTDAIGTIQNNLVLSQNRAKRIQQYFLENGMADSLLVLQVCGEEQPVSDNNSEAGRQRNRRATIDLFHITKWLKINGQLLDEKTGEGMEAGVVVRTKEKKDSIRTDTAGRFRTILPLGTVAGLDIYAKDYFFETKMFKVQPGVEKVLNIPLKKIAAGEKVDIKNLYFVGNQAVLLQQSMPELPKLLRFMELNNAIKIEIAGHINRPHYPQVDKLSWDFKLSERRAKLVYDYLLDNQISAERISYKGYGNFQMRYPNAKTEKEQSLNRRVEIRILQGS